MSADCLLKCASNGCASHCLSIAAPIRSRISAAAALVKVTTKRRSISIGFFGSVTRCMIRSTSTAVLPDPAAADTRISRSLRSMTFCCSVVHCMWQASLLPYIHVAYNPSLFSRHDFNISIIFYQFVILFLSSSAFIAFTICIFAITSSFFRLSNVR